MASISLKKSTIVRTQIAALRTVVGGLEVVAPPLAARAVERLWLTPPRPRVRPELALPETTLSVTVDGLRLPVWSFGHGLAVYLVHGWGGRAEQLSAMVHPLVQAGYRVVLFDGPAHGRSPGSTSSAVAIARALAAVVHEHGPAHAVIAHSLGSSAVAHALATGVPADRAVFVGPPAYLPTYLDRFGEAIGASPAVIERVRRRFVGRIGVPWSAFELPELAGHQTAPLLVLHDRSDAEVPLDEGRALASAWPGARLEVTDGLGHWRILRDRQVIGRIVEFVAGREDVRRAG